MHNNNITIRTWNKNDFEQVQEILNKSWEIAYLPFVPQEDLSYYLNQTYNSNRLKELFDNTDTFCFIAQIKEKAAGWLKLYLNIYEDKFYISSIYVHPEFQKLKIGQQLIDFSFSVAKEKGFLKIWIGVMEKNTIALKWYEKNGFHFVDTKPFQMGKTTINHLIGFKEIV